MPCEHYKDALIEAAASGAAPSAELRAHLAECDSCRAAYAEEQSLFAAIDSGLHAAADAEIPPSLIPRVRARLDEAKAPRLRWVQPLAVASASVVLAFVVFVLVRPHHSAPEEIAKQDPVVIPAPTVPSTNTNPEKVSSEGTQVAAVRVNHSQASRNSTNRPSAASSNPEVLVPPDEREAFARLVAVLNERRDVAAAFVAKAPEEKEAVVSIDPLQIPAMTIKPLEGSEADTSDGAGETP